MLLQEQLTKSQNQEHAWKATTGRHIGEPTSMEGQTRWRLPNACLPSAKQILLQRGKRSGQFVIAGCHCGQCVTSKVLILLLYNNLVRTISKDAVDLGM